MCRYYYRRCRDCVKLFLLSGPGIGIKVCEPCKENNRFEQRKRENAQKKARRAKLKRDKMTAGIRAGNVTWTAPNTWAPSVVDAQTLAWHSPQPEYLNTFDIGSDTMAKNHVNVFQDECGVYRQSSQIFATTMPDALQPRKYGNDTLAFETRDDAGLHQQYESEPQYFPTTTLYSPVHQMQKQEPVGLGINIPYDANWGQNHTESCSTCFFNDRIFRMEPNEWSPVFEDNNDTGEAKEFGKRWEYV